MRIIRAFLIRLFQPYTGGLRCVGGGKKWKDFCMARKRASAPRAGSLGVRILVMGLVLALVVGGAWCVYAYLQQTQPAAQMPMARHPQTGPSPSAASQGGDLVSDDHIIFGGDAACAQEKPAALFLRC